MRAWAVALPLVLVLAGCVPYPFHDTAPGVFEGDLVVRWVAPNTFVFEPDPQRPFRFVRADGSVIEPGRIVTDGGTVPNALWGIEGMSPWGYAPAFVLHDWLFQRHRCGLGPGDEAAFQESVAVIAEALRTLMGDAPSTADLERYRAIVAVSAGPLARYHWERAPCRPVQDPW